MRPLLHNFLTSQPDLNFHNPAVRREILRCMEFWLQRGVDGFRLDACNFHFCDKKLRDNPPTRGGPVFSVPLSNPYSRQEHIYDKSQPENLAFLRQVRKLFDRYGAVSMGEIGDERAVELMAQYTKGHDRLHMAYSFNLLTDDFSAAYIRDQVSQFESKMSDGWGAWSVGNHDVKRVLSRWGVGRVGEGRAQTNTFVRLIITLVGTLRGSVCWYQGDELGLIEGDVPFDKIQDPYGKTFWPKFKGRDGCRTPMPWESSKRHAGFSAVAGQEPWLPVVEQHTQNAVEVCEGDSDSPLHFMRSFLRWRKKQPELIEGALRWISLKEPLLGYVRYLPKDPDAGMLILLNLGAKRISAEVPGAALVPILEHGMLVKQFGKLCGQKITMPPFGVFLARATLF